MMTVIVMMMLEVVMKRMMVSKVSMHVYSFKIIYTCLYAYVQKRIVPVLTTTMVFVDVAEHACAKAIPP